MTILTWSAQKISVPCRIYKKSGVYCSQFHFTPYQEMKISEITGEIVNIGKCESDPKPIEVTGTKPPISVGFRSSPEIEINKESTFKITQLRFLEF